MTRAERVALETFPPDVIKTIHGEFDNNAYARALFWKGYDRCMKDVANMIDKRIGQILGDAQPGPVLRIELTELKREVGV